MKKISIFLKVIIKLKILIFGRIKYKDKYGLSYFLWPNTRPVDTYQRGVRTDDDTLLQLVLRITSVLNKSNKGRAFRGLTSAGKKSRGLRNKGKGAEKIRPSLKSNKRRAK